MRPLSCKADVSRLLSAQEQKTRHQFVTKNRLFSGCFEVCGLRKSKTSKRFLIVDLKIDTVEVSSASDVHGRVAGRLNGPPVFRTIHLSTKLIVWGTRAEVKQKEREVFSFSFYFS
jgi:hypothetical protein